VSEGQAIFSVAIRTAVIDRPRGTIEVGVGSGITADSQPAEEWLECLQKAAFVTADPRPFRLTTAVRYERDGGLFLADAHLERLAASARYFGFAFDRARVAGALAAHVASLGSGVHKVRVLLDETGQVAVESEAIPARAAAVRVALAAEPVDERDAFLYHKTTRREVYAARLASRPGCDDVLLVNTRGELTSATTGNVVLDLDGTLWTPPIDAGVLAGTYRAHLLARGEVRERRLTPADYHGAEAAFVINSVRLRREAVRLDRTEPAP
jgi:para-aminobenzoate synthetase/4-amino-4-deoxychorismate lyase